MRDSPTARFDRLVAPHLPTLQRVAFRLSRNLADAQDLVQDTCIAACEHAQDVGAAHQPLHWLLKVLHNRFLDRTRSLRRATLLPLDEADDAAPLVCAEPGPEEALLRADGEQALEAAFLELEPTQRTLLVLRAEGHGLAEITAITGIATDVLRARLHRARRSLARHLQRQAGATIVPLRAGSQP